MNDFETVTKCLAQQEQAPRALGLVAVRKLLQLEEPTIVQYIVNANLIDLIIQEMTSESPVIQNEACWCITNITSSESEEAI